MFDFIAQFVKVTLEQWPGFGAIDHDRWHIETEKEDTYKQTVWLVFAGEARFQAGTIWLLWDGKHTIWTCNA